MMRRLALMALLLVLAACQALGGEQGGASSDGHPIQWPNDPLHVVFRAEVTGGSNGDALYIRNDVPACSIYGDGRVVWTQDAFSNQVLIDRLSAARVREFVEYLTVQQRIYTYGTGADAQIPSSVEPIYELLTLHVNNVQHQTDAFAGWPTGFYDDIVAVCQSLSQAPAIFQPQEGWVSAAIIFYNPSRPTILWDSAASGLDLLELANNAERRWVTGRNVIALWAAIHESSPDVQFTDEQGNSFHVAVEVPGVSASAPPPPGG